MLSQIFIHGKFLLKLRYLQLEKSRRPTNWSGSPSRAKINILKHPSDTRSKTSSSSKQFHILLFAKAVFTILMSTKRPGVDAAIRLAKSNDVAVWNQVFSYHDQVVDLTLQARADRLAEALRDGSKVSLSQSDLLDTVIPWKFAAGKRRSALIRRLRTNTTADVTRWTKPAIKYAKDMGGKTSELDTSMIVETITQLNGVGPAAASVIMSMVRPDLFCYMYDEVIDCFLPKRTYTEKVYLACNDQCTKIAGDLKEGWTPAKVAQTLWIAAKASANGMDVTAIQQSLPQEKRKAKDDEESEPTVTTPIPSAKRPKRK